MTSWARTYPPRVSVPWLFSMVTRWPWLMAQRPRIWPMRITPWPPKPEIRISVRVLAGASFVSVPAIARPLFRHLRTDPLVHVSQDLGELGPAVGGVMLDAGLPGEVGFLAVHGPALGVLPDPLQVLEGIAGAEGVGAEVLVAGEADVDEGKAVVLERLLDDFHSLVPLGRRGLGHERRPGRLDDVARIEGRLGHAVGARVGHVAGGRGGGELPARGLVAHVVLADHRDPQVPARGVDQVGGADGGGIPVPDHD